MSESLALVVTGAPLAARTTEVARSLQAAGWQVTVVVTESSRPWLDEAGIRQVVAQPLRTGHRAPDEPKPARPAAVVVCPATFNTVNKLAAGVADTYPMSLLCESLGSGIPVVMVPMVNDLLWGHPGWERRLSLLSDAGVLFVDVRSGRSDLQPLPSASGPEVVDAFDPGWVVAALSRRRG